MAAAAGRQVPHQVVLAGMYLLAAASIHAAGLQVSTEVLLPAGRLAGAIDLGTQIVSLAYAASSTDQSRYRHRWAFAVGGSGRSWRHRDRVLVALALPLQQNFMAIALPALIAAIAISPDRPPAPASAHHEDAT